MISYRNIFILTYFHTIPYHIIEPFLRTMHPGHQYIYHRERAI